MNYKGVDADHLVGKTIVRIVETESQEELCFYLEDGSYYKMHHHQDCCEYVYLEDVCGDLDDLLNTPILSSEQVSNEGCGDNVPNYHDGSYTWTFFKIATIKGSVTFRWYGSSNGYYSETADLDYYSA